MGVMPVAVMGIRLGGDVLHLEHRDHGQEADEKEEQEEK
jgi:hypothetical protein